jgi:hypothetical protein
VPFSIRKIPDYEVIEVSMLRPYQPYECLILRDTHSRPHDSVFRPEIVKAGESQTTAPAILWSLV